VTEDDNPKPGGKRFLYTLPLSWELYINCRMRVLVVCSANSGGISPFVADQVEHLRAEGLQMEVFGIQGKGIRGYLGNLPALRRKIKDFQPDLVHAHSGMSALLAVLQRMAPVLVTFHGTDINHRALRRYSRLAMLLSKKQVVVAAHMAALLEKPELEVVPCGVDTNIFFPVNREEAASRMGLEQGKIHLLFSSSFNNPVKNHSLAQAAMQAYGNSQAVLHPLSGMNRQEVALMMNACHVCLMTSVTEGSPQFIKEALACGTSVVTTHVGDVAETIGSTAGCFICSADAKSLADGIAAAVAFAGKTKGPERIREAGLEAQVIARKLHAIFHNMLKK
jgi:glycosyltransferase involved in cell wall biosynthesis